MNWENHPVHALDLSPDRSLLAVAHTADNRVQLFDRAGKYLAACQNAGLLPCSGPGDRQASDRSGCHRRQPRSRGTLASGVPAAMNRRRFLSFGKRQVGWSHDGAKR